MKKLCLVRPTSLLLIGHLLCSGHWIFVYRIQNIGLFVETESETAAADDFTLRMIRNWSLAVSITSHLPSKYHFICYSMVLVATGGNCRPQLFWVQSLWCMLFSLDRKSYCSPLSTFREWVISEYPFFCDFLTTVEF